MHMILRWLNFKMTHNLDHVLYFSEMTHNLDHVLYFSEMTHFLAKKSEMFQIRSLYFLHLNFKLLFEFRAISEIKHVIEILSHFEAISKSYVYDFADEFLSHLKIPPVMSGSSSGCFKILRSSIVTVP